MMIVITLSSTHDHDQQINKHHFNPLHADKRNRYMHVQQKRARDIIIEMVHHKTFTIPQLNLDLLDCLNIIHTFTILDVQRI